MRKYEGFGTAYAHKQTESGDPTDGGWINLSEQRWVNSGERHRPAGRARWTVRLLAEKVVELKIAAKVSTMSVQRALKKTNLSLT